MEFERYVNKSRNYTELTNNSVIGEASHTMMSKMTFLFPESRSNIEHVI